LRGKAVQGSGRLSGLDCVYDDDSVAVLNLIDKRKAQCAAVEQEYWREKDKPRFKRIDHAYACAFIAQKHIAESQNCCTVCLIQVMLRCEMRYFIGFRYLNQA
jgi:hypothetical protein